MGPVGPPGPPGGPIISDSDFLGSGDDSLLILLNENKTSRLVGPRGSKGERGARGSKGEKVNMLDLPAMLKRC